MLLSYGMSSVGSSHLSKGVPCQDSNQVEQLSNGWLAAVIADGVGSAQHSDVASQIATTKFIEKCVKEITPTMTSDEILDVIRGAFYDANESIIKYAAAQNHPITEYDTTLSGVVYTGNDVIFGHCGDGGIVGLTNSGDYVKITQPQKASDGICVIPLRAGEGSWVFGKANGNYASVLLATDGVYDIFTPYLLREQEVSLYIPLIRYFMDNNVLGINCDNHQVIKESRLNFINGKNCSMITDDKTILVLVNSDVIPSLKEDDYYKEPDWGKLQDEWNRRAYPHLYAKESSVDVPENSNADISVQNQSTEKKSLWNRFRKKAKEDAKQ